MVCGEESFTAIVEKLVDVLVLVLVLLSTHIKGVTVHVYVVSQVVVTDLLVGVNTAEVV
jgi:hypothetical protein